MVLVNIVVCELFELWIEIMFFSLFFGNLVSIGVDILLVMRILVLVIVFLVIFLLFVLYKMLVRIWLDKLIILMVCFCM